MSLCQMSFFPNGIKLFNILWLILKKYPYRTPNGGYTAYVLMGMKKKAFDNSAAKAITSMVNQNKEEAMYAEFKKTQAFSRLEAEVAD